MAVSFLKSGKDATKQVEQAETEAKIRKEKMGEAQRFYMKEGEDRVITFLDGVINGDGILEAPSWHEHQVQLNGSWMNWFPCTSDNEPCPICDMPKSWKKLMFGFTVIDHSKYTSKSTGKVYENQKKLFIADLNTYKRLQKKAALNGGLTGVTLAVSRIGDKSPGTGSEFDVVGKATLAEVAAKYSLKLEDLGPYNYGEVIVYRPAKELRALGLGNQQAIIGSADTQVEDKTDYSKAL